MGVEYNQPMSGFSRRFAFLIISTVFLISNATAQTATIIQAKRSSSARRRIRDG
jgi:hypothetical protein